MQMKGVGRYTAHTLRHLAQLDSVNEYFVLVRKDTQLPDLAVDTRFHYLPIILHNHYFHGWWILPQQARQLCADLVWIPYETTLGVFPCPYLVVCHDVPQLITQAQSKAGDRLSLLRRGIIGLDLFLIKRSLRKANIVFANSHFVGGWLRNNLGISSAKVHYAPCAPGADFATHSRAINRTAILEKLDCPNSYILIFATGDQRENLGVALQVFDQLVTGGATQNLVIAGIREKDEAQIEEQIQRFSWRDRVRLLPFYGEDQVTNLVEAYTCAKLYLDLSLHEGFGMQVIEAMACGTPVVCSDRGALPEVTRGAAILINPENVQKIVDAVQSLLSSSSLDSWRERGKIQAARFSWSNTAQTILNSMRKV
jgi:alpha-1,3-rhamnosyl/mannosyltransferase